MPIKDAQALRNGLEKDYIITKELSTVVVSLTLKCGRLLMVANMAVITMKHIDFSHVFAEPSYPSHEADGYPLEGIDDVPGSANAKQSLRLLPELHC